MSMSSLFIHDSVSAIFEPSEPAAYGALWLVVTITSSPAALQAAKARSCASTRSCSPSVSSMSKQMPSKPAALTSSSPASTASIAAVVTMPSALAPPSVRNWRRVFSSFAFSLGPMQRLHFASVAASLKICFVASLTVNGGTVESVRNAIWPSHQTLSSGEHLSPPCITASSAPAMLPYPEKTTSMFRSGGPRHAGDWRKGSLQAHVFA
mmetsp:Transcript_62048/g.149465  ORF Transcript_62048/g.149465 Transcript_62048/m.149465 type:complete len:209 (-) Transcript_62048:458-1084(-)